MNRLLFAGLLVGLTVGCAAQIPENREAAFIFAVDQLQSGRPAVAASAAWRYLEGASPDDPRYDRAQRLLARTSQQLGLSYSAAQSFLDIAQGRRDPEILAEAIRGLQAIIESGAYDEDALVEGYLASADIDGLPEDLQAFINYHQGLRDVRLMRKKWAQDNFAKLPAQSVYADKARYVDAVESVARRELAPAIEKLIKIEKTPDLDGVLASDVRRSLARLYSTTGQFDEALKRYELLRQEAPGDPELLFEMAWVHYDQGDIRRSLGLLLALDAPVYSDLIAPDRFLLEALALRRLCQFGPARRAATRLRAKHGDALDELYQGVPLLKSKAMRAAARRRTAVKTQSAFYDRVLMEQRSIEDKGLSPELTQHLTTLYERGVQEAKRGLEARLAGEVDALAEELLEAEEGVNLLLHELGVGLLRGRERAPGPALVPAPEVTAGGRNYFRFQESSGPMNWTTSSWWRRTDV